MRKIRQAKEKKIWKQEMCIHSNPAGYANFQSTEVELQTFVQTGYAGCNGTRLPLHPHIFGSYTSTR